jgi:GT2 family glycosyltransferase
VDSRTPEAPVIDELDRVRVVKTSPHGLAAARNLGVSLTRAPIVAFTDDDCEVEPGWLEAIAGPFANDQRIGIVFGTVRAGKYDRSAGFIQAYEIARPRVARGVASQWRINGIAGCMAVRRSTFDAIHGFDEQFGAGARLRAAEDTDLVSRALAAGHWVAETPAAVVTHFGFRAWSDARRVIEGYMFGLGAMHAKMLRLRRRAAIRPIADLAWRWLAGGPVVDLNHRPPRLMRLAAFLRGAFCAWGMSLDSTTGLLASEASPPLLDAARSGKSLRDSADAFMKLPLEFALNATSDDREDR